MPDLEIDPALSVNETLHRHPGMVPLFAAAGIDTCCGGAESLGDAARLAGADLGMLLTAMRIEHTRSSGDTRVPAGAPAGRAR